MALVDLLIDQQEAARAFSWTNRATAADVIDYTRLVEAKVSNPEAQKLIDDWNQIYQQIQALNGQLETNPPNRDMISAQLKQLWEKNRELEAEMLRRFPEVAELFETQPEDMAKLQAALPAGTVAIQPVLLTNTSNVPNNIALFVVGKDRVTVTKVSINPQEFDEVLAKYRGKLENPVSDQYGKYQRQLYDWLIRPIEGEIAAAAPQQLAIIPTGKLRYIPFETLYDQETGQYLLEKYPIHYLTRISPRALGRPRVQGERRVLALGNPVPVPPQNLPAAEEEAKNIHQTISGELYIRDAATLGTFRDKSPGFSLVHLATHGCFRWEGCDKLGMPGNTLLFANKETFNLADTARLGLDNTDIIALSACETAISTVTNGAEIAGIAYLFEQAGVRSVMASLWNVEDKAGKDVMVRFYANLQQGMTKAEALRQAKLAQIKVQPHPFYWSPFILIGDGG